MKVTGADCTFQLSFQPSGATLCSLESAGMKKCSSPEGQKTKFEPYFRSGSILRLRFGLVMAKPPSQQSFSCQDKEFRFRMLSLCSKMTVLQH